LLWAVWWVALGLVRLIQEEIRDLEKEKGEEKFLKQRNKSVLTRVLFYCQVEKNSFFYFSAAKNTSPMK
jgi:hypothetical protein